MARKCITRVIDINRVSDRMIVFKVLVQGIISSVILVYLDDFYDSLINVVRKLGEKEILVIACGFHGHVGSDPENYEDQHGGYGY